MAERFDHIAPWLHALTAGGIGAAAAAVFDPSHHELWALVGTLVLVGSRVFGIVYRGRGEPNLPQLKRDALRVRAMLHRLSNDAQYLLTDLELLERGQGDRKEE